MENQPETHRNPRSISTVCVNCGRVSLTGSDLKMLYIVDREEYYYSFKCLEDDSINLKTPTRLDIDKIISAGIPLKVINFSVTRLNEGMPDDDKARYSITGDEQIDFSLALRSMSTDQIIDQAKQTTR